MKKWLSIIVPIYNSEEYLSECLDSLVHQDFPLDKYEIILYNDGSQDNSLNIMEKYKAQYSNIRVYTHPNIGVSQTRNCALNVAEGEYVWFIDSDDLIAKNILSKLYDEVQKSKPDIMVLKIRSFRGSPDNSIMMFEEYNSEISMLQGIQFYMTTNHMTFASNRLIRREFLNHYQLRFVPNIYAEDHELNIRCYYHAKNVCYFPIFASWYRMRENSLSHAVASLQKMIDSMLIIMIRRLEYMKMYPHPSFWSYVLVHDMRRLHYFLIISKTESVERKIALSKERQIMKEILYYLPIVFSFNFCIIKAVAICPQLLFILQKYLRFLKYLKK